MALKDMKRTKADKKAKEESYKCSPGGGIGGDEYPWSLRITLDDEQLKKLGISSLPKAGTKMSLSAEVSVVGVRQSDRDNGNIERSLELQIRKMDLGAKSAGSALDAVDAAIDEAD